MSDYEGLTHRIRSCTLCSLSEKRTQAVPGEGSLDADIMFVGEGPGFYEDRDGRPFVGPAGKFLDELLQSIGLRRETVYITNMVKCRPPNNRDPLPGEVSACRPYLDSQLEMISPEVIVTLGRHSFSKFFPSQSLTRARGRSQQWRNLTVYPIYHPAAALHNPRLRSVIVEDFSRLPDVVRSAREADREPEPAPTRQLNLFE